MVLPLSCVKRAAMTLTPPVDQLAGDVIDRTKRTLRKRMQGEAIDVKTV